MVTSCPLRIRSPATVSPPGPEPTTATFLPVLGAMGGMGMSERPRAQSAAKRSRLPMETGVSFLPTMHRPWHWLSWGQTRPQTAGRLFFSHSLRMAWVKSPSAM